MSAAVGSTSSRTETRVQAGPGVELALRWSIAPKAKGAILLVHGVGEHGGRYAGLEKTLVDAGWSFFVYDHRGHGQSTGRRGHVNAFDDYVDDLQKVFEETQAIAGKGKVFVYGHSMGGLIAATWAALRRPTVWGVILSAPAFRIAVQVPAAKILAAKVLSRVVPTLALANEVDPAVLCRDPAVCKAYAVDPLVERKATVRWGAEFLAAVARINLRASEMQAPYLLLHGTADRITSHEGSKAFHAKTASADKTLKLYDGYFHELHNEPEPDRKRFVGDLTSWLNARA